jgi:hypothetical protein
VGCTQALPEDPVVDTGLGPGTLFRLKFLGSVQVDEDDPKCCKRRVKKVMVEEAVLKIKVYNTSILSTKCGNHPQGLLFF